MRLSEEREVDFWSKTILTDGCWEWIGSINSSGYGSFSVSGKSRMAHRVSYEHFRGPIPSKMTIDHVCNNRACVNPAHLRIASQRENVLRGNTFASDQAAMTHCVRGHELSGDNLYVQPKNGQRRCVACDKMRKAKYRAKTKPQGGK